MDLVIANGIIITPSERYTADVGIKGGKIIAIGQRLQGKEGIDASHKLVMPGGVDPHTHFALPWMGTTSADDFYTGTVAAACGGTTTIIDYAQQEKGQGLSQVLEIWHVKARGRAVVDYSFHMALAEVNGRVLNELGEMPAHGITSFKAYLAYEEMIDDAQLLQLLERAKELNCLVAVHCENGRLVEYMTRELLAQGKTEPCWHPYSRPPTLEAEATSRALVVASLAQAPLYIVHLTCAQALTEVRVAQARGQPVLVETCPQYLVFDANVYDAPGFRGAQYVVSPPMREPEDVQALWTALTGDEIQAIGSDHCSYNMKGQKELGQDDFSRIPNGMPTVETRMSLLYHFGVNEGRISPNRFVELVATNPARIFGLWPRKGAIAVGADADLVVWDPEKEVRLAREALHMNVDHSPYEGIVVRGYPELVLCRGKVVVRDNNFVGQPGIGRYVRRKPFEPQNLFP